MTTLKIWFYADETQFGATQWEAESPSEMCPWIAKGQKAFLAAICVYQWLKSYCKNRKQYRKKSSMFLGWEWAIRFVWCDIQQCNRLNRNENIVSAFNIIVLNHTCEINPSPPCWNGLQWLPRSWTTAAWCGPCCSRRSQLFFAGWTSAGVWVKRAHP